MHEIGGTRSTHGDARNVYIILVGNLNRSDPSADFGTDERAMSKWIFQKYGAKLWTGFN
jgi:hypothetical protein